MTQWANWRTCSRISSKKTNYCNRKRVNQKKKARKTSKTTRTYTRNKSRNCRRKYGHFKAKKTYSTRKSSKWYPIRKRKTANSKLLVISWLIYYNILNRIQLNINILIRSQAFLALMLIIKAIGFYRNLHKIGQIMIVLKRIWILLAKQLKLSRSEWCPDKEISVKAKFNSKTLVLKIIWLQD